MADESGTAFDATTVRGLQDGTLDGYLRQLRRLARLERMRPGDGARGILEARLMQVVQGDLSESAAKTFWLRRGWQKKWSGLPRWCGSLIGTWLCVSNSGGAKTSGRRRRSGRNWRTCAGCVRLPPALRNGRRLRWRACRWDTACGVPRRGGGVGQEAEGVRFFGTKSRRGVQRQEVGPWVREWLQFLAKLRALKGFHPDRGAWHESREALGKTLVRLLERGEGKKTVRWHSFRRMGAAQLRKMGAPLTTIMLWGGWKSAKVAQMYTEAPPRWKFARSGKIPWPMWGGGAEPGYCTKQGSTLSFWPSWIRREIDFAAGEASRLAGGSPEGG